MSNERRKKDNQQPSKGETDASVRRKIVLHGSPHIKTRSEQLKERLDAKKAKASKKPTTRPKKKKGPPLSRTAPPHFSSTYQRNPDCSVFDATNTHPPIHEEPLIHDCADAAPQLATPSVTGTPRIRCPKKGHGCVSEFASRMNGPRRHSVKTRSAVPVPSKLRATTSFG